MNNSLLASRYAKALLLQAESEGVAEQLYGLLKPVVVGALASPLVTRVLASPTHSREHKEGVLLHLSEEPWPELWGRFVALILSADREAFVAQIARRFLALYRQQHNIVEVRLTTARAADKESLERIVALVGEYYGGASVELTTLVDEAIEGGFVLSVGDHRLDASLKGQIDKIRTQLLKRNKTLV